MWISGEKLQYGDIGTWKVSAITDMSKLFKNGRAKAYAYEAK